MRQGSCSRKLLQPPCVELRRLAGGLPRRENQQLWDWLDQSIEFPPPRQQQFAATASAMGLSLTQLGVLLSIVLGAAAPARSTIGRWIDAACAKATAVLAVLDRACCRLALSLCLDEIFFRRQPVLVGVEPASMAWLIGQRAADRSGATWFQTLQPWDQLELVVADGGTGMQNGLKQLNESRAACERAAIEVGLDVFHTQKEALPVVLRKWKSAEAVWEKAEAADRSVARAQAQGQDARGTAAAARAAWTRAEQAFHAAEATEATWRRAEAALELFRPDGTLNDRCAAEAELEAVRALLAGDEWAKVRRMLADARTLTFLDRMHRQLAEAEPNETLRRELARLWWMRRERRRKPEAALWHSRIAVQQALCARLNAGWRESYVRVARVLRGTVRASSVVECMNSVLRMHQSRHRHVSQGMLDLKRLYWNCRAFREGRRRGRSPYAHLGLPVGGDDWWTVLNTDPATLAQKLSTP